MELWDWNMADKDFWSRFAKSLHCQKRQSHRQEKWQKTRFSACPWKDALGNGNTVHPEVQNANWEIGGSCVDTEPTAWGLDAQVWNLLWTEKEAMKKGMPILQKAGFESVEESTKDSRRL